MIVEPSENNFSLSVPAKDLNWAKVANFLASELLDHHSNIRNTLNERIDVPELETKRATKALKRLAVNGGRGILCNMEQHLKAQVISSYMDMEVLPTPTIIIMSVNKSKKYSHFFEGCGYTTAFFQKNINGYNTATEINDDYDVLFFTEKNFMTFTKEINDLMDIKGQLLVVVDSFEQYFSSANQNRRNKWLAFENVSLRNFPIIYMSDTNLKNPYNWIITEILVDVIWTEQQSHVIQEISDNMRSYDRTQTKKDFNIDKKRLINNDNLVTKLRKTGLVL